MTSQTQLPTLPLARVVGREELERAALVGKARWLTWLSLGWHGVEAAVAIAAGVMAGSVSLIGFGADSLIEAAAGLVVLWLVSADRLSSHRAERRAQQLIAASFLLLAAYVTAESARDLIGGHHAQASWCGLALRRSRSLRCHRWRRRSAVWDEHWVPRRR